MNEIAPPTRSAELQPSSYVDRRALSEAWYDALYRSRNVRATAAKKNAQQRRNEGMAAPSRALIRSDQRAQRPFVASAPASKRLRSTRAALTAYALERMRARVQPTASRPLCGNALFRRTLCRAKLPDQRSVDMLVQQRGDVLRLVAIYDGRSAASVAAALRQSRLALAQRGIRIEIDTIEKETA